MDEIFEQFPTKEAFDKFFQENYTEVKYEDVQAEFEDYVKSVDKHIFLSDYEENNSISRGDFIENLHEDAQFFFQDTLTEVFYDKNPDVYETAFGLYEAAQMEGKPELDVSGTFHETFQSLYQEFLGQIFDTFFA